MVEKIDLKYLRNKPYRITLPDAPAPTSNVLEKIYYPNEDLIFQKVKSLVRGD